MKWRAYFRLMRFHKPVGILLLWFPTAWALWLANHGIPPLKLLIYFLLGTIFMRAAGCVINDIADRHVDKHVTRTRMRPLTTGEVSLPEALLLFIGLLLGAFIVLIQLPPVCFYYALAALFITILYPFCKRFFEAPQVVLGLAFSMGIPMAYAASDVRINTTAILLFLLNFAWIISYDTMYALVDKEDDLRIGVKSTAVLFGSYNCFIIALLQCFFHVLWLLIAFKEIFSIGFYICWVTALPLLVFQQYLIRRSNTKKYFTAFSSNTLYGFLMWCALIVS